ncbi:MAG TPA: S41 family peptidase [Pyrinomonadaceae bacterium]
MKKHTTLFGLLLSIILAFSSVPAQTGTAISKNNPKTQTETKSAAKVVSTETIETDVAEALSIIEQNHVSGKTLDYNELFKTSIDSMLHTLDPHSNYFDAKEFEQFRTDQSSRYFGIGATIGDLSDANGNVIATYIKATFEGAPANRAGLGYGDKILEVNGTSMLGKPFSEVRTFLRGPRGTVAKLTVEKYGTGKRETVDIIRDAVAQPSISEAYMIRPGVGYINMSGGFNTTTYTEFRQAMTDLKAAGMQQLVIDLRNNGGGLVNQAYYVANTFIGKGQTIFTQKGRLDGTADTYPSTNATPDETPLVVLVNRNTASASEILAGALQDHDRALIVGENSFGKGLVQNPFQLEYGSMLLLTIAKYETPSGRLIQRDYSKGDLYDYYTKGGTYRDENGSQTPTGEQTKTDSGRIVYGGGGITPDEVVKPQTVTNDSIKVQQKLVNPVFAFALDLAFGKVPGFETFKADKPIKFDYDIKQKDFEITDSVYQAFKTYAAQKYKIPAAQVDKEKVFVLRTLRTELVTAAYGSQTSFQVFNEYDNQLLKAIEVLPQAKQLALEGAKANAKKLNSSLTNR